MLKDGAIDPNVDTPYSLTESPFVARAEADGWKTNFMRRTVSLDEIARIVARDTVPAINDPTFLAAKAVIDSLDPREPVIAIEINGDARAYPLDILLQHEIVNDTIGGLPVIVTFCPLCNSAVAFERTVAGETRLFGVSGFLRKSDLVMYDDFNETMWQQITGNGIVGDDAGKVLIAIPVQTVSWETFIERFPEGQVLERPDFPNINYDETPYQGYDDDDNTSPFLFFEIPDRRIPVIERVAAFDLGTGPAAYAFSFLKENPVVNDALGDIPIVIFFDDRTESAFLSNQGDGEVNISGASTAFFRELGDRTLTFRLDGDGVIRDEQTGSGWDRFGLATSGELEGEELVSVIHGDHFWFAWAAFKPDTALIVEEADLLVR
ncbi:MAG: DUF3179 domain-containing protein [Chloroflexi bacterium]|nr:DUF3179 domain-containing protein [Chloroflexota bacterium]